MNIAVIFGGKSTEHNISIVSGTSVITNLDQEKYNIYPIYIDVNGDFYLYNKNIKNIQVLKLGEPVTDLIKIENIIEYLKKMDVVLPVLHGRYGEDGSIQGLLELISKKYVGCRILASALCMDKTMTKRILNSVGISQAKYLDIRKKGDKYIYYDQTLEEQTLTAGELITLTKKKLNFPVFVKPSNSGSSVGVNKVVEENDLISYVEEALNYDSKILIEEEILGREVECAIVGKDDLIVSTVGEVLAAGDFYSFDAKYKNVQSMTKIPASLNEDIIEKIKRIAAKAYKTCDCSGLARIDFFIKEQNQEVILNEINTMPGFTDISMFPKLMADLGLDFKSLLDYLIMHSE